MSVVAVVCNYHSSYSVIGTDIFCAKKKKIFKQINKETAYDIAFALW